MLIGLVMNTGKPSRKIVLELTHDDDIGNNLSERRLPKAEWVRASHHMKCFCGREFHWEDVNLDIDALAAYRRAASERTFDNSNDNDNDNDNDKDKGVTKCTLKYTKFVLAEFVFRRRLLETAHEILISSLAKKKRQRPIVLNTEDDCDIIESLGYKNHYRKEEDQQLSRNARKRAHAATR
mmetsp:Transcript_18748/g.46558  ORF Transcript_18748/g.46558 Transcript_18748/m.46558 type:complete len:181 (+) Transcript_18748:431-973(+)|eukprot:CAMPEP_0116099858 /NCGR_PEP_ID=MMETSP0327-20121206/11990_1 /TAXON_ID=44447 /ORGANISM="Pseudo-nitzschia delicatissima, Strain B596" /LENGTH=180 /DNA_ID=CAMNT_0003591759 /DNA_START=395 /DNA_END=937 /DNA_ORIENTATION=-